MRVLLLSRYGPLGPSSRVRFYQYIPYLQAHGVEFQVAPLLDNSYVSDLFAGRQTSAFSVISAYLKRIALLAHSRSFDLLWIEKELLPWFPPWAERLLDVMHIPYVVDYDDAVFHRYDMHPNPIMRKLLGKSIDTIMHNSTVVIAGNDYIAERAQKAGAKQIEYLPSAIKLDRYPLVTHESHQEFRIGWIGTPITLPYLTLIIPILKSLSGRINLRLVIIGADYQNADLPIEIIPWSEQTEVADIMSCDVGIMPLPDAPFERGKCGYKLIQYMGCSLPVISSPVGINNMIVNHGQGGFLASSPEEWEEALLTLYHDVGLRNRMGKVGRIKVERDYNLEITAPKLLEILEKAAHS